MCDPVTAVTAIGGGLSAAGEIQGGIATSAAARANAAQIEAQKAARLSKAAYDTEAEGRKFVRTDGAMRAQIAASGVTMGSFSDVLADSASEHALAVESIKWSAQNDANNLQYQADAANRQADQAKTASYLNAGSAVVGAVSGYYKSSGLGRTSGGVSVSSPWATSVSYD